MVSKFLEHVMCVIKENCEKGEEDMKYQYGLWVNLYHHQDTTCLSHHITVEDKVN